MIVSMPTGSVIGLIVAFPVLDSVTGAVRLPLPRSSTTVPAGVPRPLPFAPTVTVMWPPWR